MKKKANSKEINYPPLSAKFLELRTFATKMYKHRIVINLYEQR